jgi:fructose-specific component phosphotransferase system IIB-like protein
VTIDTYEVGAAKKALLEIIEQAQEAEAIIARIDWENPALAVGRVDGKLKRMKWDAENILTNVFGEPVRIKNIEAP